MKIKEIETEWIKTMGLGNECLIDLSLHLVPKLLAIAKAVDNLPFGEHMALPWCRESFPELDNAIKNLEDNGNMSSRNFILWR